MSLDDCDQVYIGDRFRDAFENDKGLELSGDLSLDDSGCGDLGEGVISLDDRFKFDTHFVV